MPELRPVWKPARSENESAPGVTRLYPAGANTQSTDACPIYWGSKLYVELPCPVWKPARSENEKVPFGVTRLYPAGGKHAIN